MWSGCLGVWGERDCFLISYQPQLSAVISITSLKLHPREDADWAYVTGCVCVWWGLCIDLRLGTAVMKHLVCAVLQTSTKTLCVLPVHTQHLDMGVRQKGLGVLLYQGCLAIPTASLDQAHTKDWIHIYIWLQRTLSGIICDCVLFTD